MVKKALVVDDSGTMRKLISSVLKERAGFDEVIEAEDGKDALKKLSANNINMICTDFEMPNVNGGEFIANVRKMNRYENLPILVITSKSESRDTVKQAGANGMVQKPFVPETILSAVQKLMMKAANN